jgi:hypothetical protein
MNGLGKGYPMKGAGLDSQTKAVEYTPPTLTVIGSLSADTLVVAEISDTYFCKGSD